MFDFFFFFLCFLIWIVVLLFFLGRFYNAVEGEIDTSEWNVEKPNQNSIIGS